LRERVEMAFTAMSASAGLAPNVPRVCQRASKPGRLRGRAFRIPRAAESDGAGGGLWYVDEEQKEMFASKWDRPVLRVGAEGQTLPLPEMRIVDDKKMQKVEFVSATEDAEDCPPPDGLPEVAVIGRSNVGKSSLLNLLTKGKSGALVSSKPGTTQHINHYLVANKWWIVDLPGYGFAEASQESTEMWEKFTKDYFTTRSNLAGVLLLVDASIPPMDKDLEYADWLITHNVPFTVVHTKCDRDKPGMPSVDENREALRLLLDEKWHRLPSMIPTSSVSQDGREDVLKFISSIILFRRKRNADAKEAKRRAKVKARKAAKPLKQKHRERKPKPGGDGEAGDERDEADEGDDDDDEFDAPTQVVAKKKQLSMQELIAKELGDIQGGL
jgi:GTP-binding protein